MSTPKVAVLVPSRGRPENVRRLMAAFAATVEQSDDTRLYVAVDTDDPCWDEYKALPWSKFVVMWGIEQRLRLGGTLNDVAPVLARDFDVVGFMGDDHVPITGGWDHTVASIVKRTPGSVVYGNDLIQGANLPTAVFMDSRIVRTLGWFVVPGMTHLFMDNLWKTLGEQLGTLRYLPDVIIEHVHPIAGKAEWDAGYVEANDGAVWAHDEAIYHEWVAFQMPTDIAKVKAAL